MTSASNSRWNCPFGLFWKLDCMGDHPPYILRGDQLPCPSRSRSTRDDIIHGNKGIPERPYLCKHLRCHVRTPVNRSWTNYLPCSEQFLRLPLTLSPLVHDPASVAHNQPHLCHVSGSTPLYYIPAVSPITVVMDASRWRT